MRPALAAVLVLSAFALAAAQPPKPVEPRFGVKHRDKAYPQATPKAALKSAIDAIEAADFAYLVAHLLDPKFVDATVDDRQKQLVPAAEAELAQLRDFQRANPDKVDAESRVPLDPMLFRAAAAEKARDRAFKLLVREVTAKLVDDPETLKALRRVYREGTFTEGDPATATHPEVKNRTLFFKKLGDYWVLENRQAAEPKKEPQKEPR
jgi:hypothetical protein